MGIRQSTYTDTVGIGGRESDTSSPDCFMIEPVPEGLEHVVYPKYEEAFRLGLEAFSNPMRVNKFKRPLPHILGTIEFQKQPHAGIVPTAKPSCSSGMPTPQPSPFHGHGSGDARPADQVEEYFNMTAAAGMFVFEEENVPPEDEEVYEVEQGAYVDDESVQSSGRSPTDVPGIDHDLEEVISQTSQPKLDPCSSISQLDGGLFDSDHALTNALEVYRRSEESTARKLYSTDENQTITSPHVLPTASLKSLRQQQQQQQQHQTNSSRSQGERSQVSKDLEVFGKSLSDLQTQRAAGTKTTTTTHFTTSNETNS